MSSLILGGDTSGTITLTVPTAAGTNTITLPASTGTAITTASTSGIPNTINWTTVQTSSVSPAVAGTGYPMNTTSGALTVTLPAAPVAGNMISIVDYAGTAATNNITLNPNGNNIQGSTANGTISTNRDAINDRRSVKGYGKKKGETSAAPIANARTTEPPLITRFQ